MKLTTTLQAKSKDYYLFTYFNNAEKEGQYVWFSISEDGVDFTPVNEGKPIIAADNISVSGTVRDPHMLRADNGWFLQVVTDMDMSLGKWTCRGIVMMRSKDMVNWEHHKVHFPDRCAGKDAAKADAVWAPQTICDPLQGNTWSISHCIRQKMGLIPRTRFTMHTQTKIFRT